MTGDRALTYPLTDEERALVERYHNHIPAHKKIPSGDSLNGQTTKLLYQE